MRDAQIDEIVAAADPLVRAGEPQIDETTKAELLASVVASERAQVIGVRATPARGARRRVARTLIAAAAICLLSAAAWSAISARTGIYGAPGSEEGAGEHIRLDAPDAGPIVDEIGADIPLPPGSSFEAWKAKVLRPDPDGHGVMMTESGIRSTMSYVAACQWTGYWLQGFERRDEAIMRDALTVLEDIPTWEAIVGSDGGGVVASLEMVARGARERDPSLFMDHYRINCTDAHPQIGG